MSHLIANDYIKVSDAPPIAMINANIVQDRIDAHHFNVKFLDEFFKIKSYSSDILSNHFNVTKLAGFEYTKFFVKQEQANIPAITSLNVQDCFLNLDKTIFITNDVHEQLERSSLFGGEVVLSYTGAYRRAAVIPLKSNLHLGPNVCVLKPKGMGNSYFLASYLNCFYGQILLEREITISAQPTVNMNRIRNLLIPIPESQIQSYIGSKVRLAEKCREEAKDYRKRIYSLLKKHAHLSEIEQAFNEQKKHLFHQIEPLIVLDRIDSEFYQPSYLEVDKIIKSRSHSTLVNLVDFPIKGLQPIYDADGSIPALTGTHIDPDQIDIESPQKVSKEWADSKQRSQAKKDEILITVTGPPLGEAAVVHDYHCPLVINSHIARITTKNIFPYPFYIAAILNSAIGSIQVYRHCKGVRQKELYPEDICQFIIPKIDEDKIEQIDQLCKKADVLEQKSKNLISEAKSDIEKLIEGKLDTEGIISGRIKAPTWEDIESDLIRETGNEN